VELLVVIAVIGIALNVGTAALLPVAVTVEGSFFAALGAGVGASLAFWRRWWKPLAAQLLLLGFFTFLVVSYSYSGGHSSKTNWGVNSFWVGGYESDCRWYTKYMEALEAPTVDWVIAVLALAFGVLAIAVKLHIAQQLETPDIAERPRTEPRPKRRPPPGIALRRARKRVRRSRSDAGGMAPPGEAPQRPTEDSDTPPGP